MKMGMVYEEITLRNVGDVTDVERGFMKEPEIREVTVQALVDTGAGTLIISEAIRKELGLGARFRREATLANGEKVICMKAETVMVHWKNRSMTCEPWVLPGVSDQKPVDVLLGSIPLENMDLMVDSKNRKLVGAHGDKPMGRIW
jgi:clan AA aspartic protease